MNAPKPASDSNNPPSLDLEAYLHRIGYTGSLKPSLSVLQALLEAHVTHIPFENLDVLLDRPISLDLQDLQRKLISRKRGGYCFEINTLFATLLRNLGFTVSTHGGRVYFGRENTKERPRTHMVLIAHLEGQKWLIDATFGALGLRFPVCIAPLVSDDAAALTSPLRIVPEADAPGSMLLQSYLWGSWQDLYVFDEYPMKTIDYEVANFYTSQFPASPFRKHLIAMLAGKRGFPSTMIRNTELTVTDGIKREIEILPDQQTLQKTLSDMLSLHVEVDELKSLF